MGKARIDCENCKGINNDSLAKNCDKCGGLGWYPKIKPSKVDSYNAGKCPECGEFATGTQRHIGAPVFCDNGHSWQKPTVVMLQKRIAKLKKKLKKAKAGK